LGALLFNMQRFPEKMAKMYTAETTLALQYTHENGIVRLKTKHE